MRALAVADRRQRGEVALATAHEMFELAMRAERLLHDVFTDGDGTPALISNSRAVSGASDLEAVAALAWRLAEDLRSGYFGPSSGVRHV